MSKDPADIWLAVRLPDDDDGYVNLDGPFWDEAMTQRQGGYHEFLRLMMIFFLNYRYHQRGDTFRIAYVPNNDHFDSNFVNVLYEMETEMRTEEEWKQMFRNLTNFSMIKYDLKIYYRQKGTVLIFMFKKDEFDTWLGSQLVHLSDAARDSVYF